MIIDFDGTKRLSIEKKAQILRNNIFGIDIDHQAVEIAMMSLYLKCLEGEKDLPQKKELLPSLAKNIRCGNSLISYDIFDQLNLFDEEEKDRINPFDWHSKSTGFGEIMEKGGFDVVIGNPPYYTLALGKQQKLMEKLELEYLKPYFSSSFEYKGNTFALFYELASRLVKQKGLFGFIVPRTILSNQYFWLLRKYLLFSYSIKNIVSLPFKVFEDAEIGGTSILIIKRAFPTKKTKVKVSYSIQPNIFKEKGKIDQYLFTKIPNFKLYLEKKDLELILKMKEKAMHDKMVKLVDKMLELNKRTNTLPPSSKREKIEREIKITDEKIDELVYELYGITEEERKITEGET